MYPASEWTSGSLVDEIADVLRERIIEGLYAADAPLSQRGLAKELSVARGVVGEALRTLRREGLVDLGRTGARTRVAAPDRCVFLSAYEPRAVTDGLAARLAAGHLGPAIEKRCEGVLEEQRAAVSSEDRLRYMRANVSFHAAIIDVSGNPVLRKYLWLVRCTSRSALLLGVGRMRQTVEEHEGILAAVCRDDPEQAEKVARAHVRATIEALELSSDPPDRRGARARASELSRAARTR
jgi:DNA-binding GntR family transcriptional regulator